MPDDLALAPDTAPAPPPVVPRRFSWEDVIAMSQAGLFAETERVELVAGELIIMPEEGPLHVDALEALRDWLEAALPTAFKIFVRAPLRLPSGTVFVPDLCVAPRGTRARDMTAENAALVIEISDSTLNRDQRRKRPAYAAAGVKEFWIVDPAGRRIVIHREPQGGEWGFVRTLGEGAQASPLIAPEAAFAVTDLPSDA